MAKPTLEVVWPRRVNGDWNTWCRQRHQITLTLILSHPGEETLENMLSYFRPARRSRNAESGLAFKSSYPPKRLSIFVSVPGSSL